MTLWAITGGNGYIGRALGSRLASEGIKVRTLAGDVRDAGAVSALVEGADVVVHLAAYVHRAVRTAAEREECRAVNVDGTANVVNAIREHAPDALLVHVSTANVYAPSDGPLTEESALGPTNEYGKTKLEAEQLVLASPVPAAIIRPAMVFGPGAPGNFPRLVSMVRRGLIADIGGGHNRKSLLPVETLVDAMLAIAEKRASGVFNVAGGDPLTMHEIGLVIAGALNRKARRVPLPLPLLRYGARVADAVLGVLPRRLPKLAQLVESYASSVVLDDTKLRTRLGFAPRTSVREAIEKAAR